MLPNDLAVGADYGLTVIDGADPVAQQLVRFILSSKGQGIFARHGFEAPAR